MLSRKLMFGLGTCLLLCSWVTIAVQGQATKTVRVDCARGKTINAALNANQNVFRLTIEIDGICNENLRIERSRVTLIGDDPATDGINGVSTDLTGPTVGSTIAISRAAGVTLENLRISGGIRHGITTAYSNFITVENCIVENNAINGLNIIRMSIIRVFDSEITGGTGDGVRVNLSSAIRVFDSEITGGLGGRGNGVQVTNSSIAELTDTMVIEGARWGLLAQDHSTIIMTGNELEGSVNIGNKSILRLFGVEQTALGGRPNTIDDDSRLETDCTDPSDCPSGDPTTLMDVELDNFSNASFAESDIGNLVCSSGSDAFCDGTETKTGSSCALCP